MTVRVIKQNPVSSMHAETHRFVVKAVVAVLSVEGASTAPEGAAELRDRLQT